jgi:hypothetical protein
MGQKEEKKIEVIGLGSKDGVLLATPQDLREFETAKMIGDHLEKKYPGYLWMVHASETMGIVRFWSKRLTGKYCMLMHYSQFENDPELKIVTLYGGEFLERFKVRIGAVDNDQLHNKRQIAGEYAFDYHEIKNGKASAAAKMRFDFFG